MGRSGEHRLRAARNGSVASPPRQLEIVYADGEVHEFEDNMVWRVAELLGVSRRERLRLKKQIAKARAED